LKGNPSAKRNSYCIVFLHALKKENHQYFDSWSVQLNKVHMFYNNLEEEIWNTTMICTASRYYELHELYVFHPELPRFLLQ
jgi:hypothetical protein